MVRSKVGEHCCYSLRRICSHCFEAEHYADIMKDITQHESIVSRFLNSTTRLSSSRYVLAKFRGAAPNCAVVDFQLASERGGILSISVL